MAGTHHHDRSLAVINFCFDDLGDYALGYPNLARPGLQADEFDTTWPRVLPLRLLVYLRRSGVEFQVHLVEQAPLASWYPVAFAWHDFDCDYFALMPPLVHTRLRTQEIRVLFYYHEGDHPGRIQHHLDQLCVQHRLPLDCYVFVSANTAAKSFARCLYFNDHEYFFSYINRHQSAAPVQDRPRTAEFTALSRVHKWWRASVMSDLRHHGVLDRSLWSYNTECSVQDLECDNPLELDSMPGWRQRTHEFVTNGPYVCDSPDPVSHNDHRYINAALYQDSYCHLVLETLFDVDGSGGCFLTEKTFKCIKFGQPFVIIGAARSLDTLRQQGYRVFDHAIDNSYDDIANNTQRWLAVRSAIQRIQQQDMRQWFRTCVPDIMHNQQQFASMRHQALQRLAADLDTIK